MTAIKRIALVRIVDDDEIVRESYKFLLEGEGWIVKTYKDAEEFLQSDDPLIPGCAVFDVRMPNMSGLELQQKLKQMNRDIPIIFVSAHGDIEMAVLAVKNGAWDFIPKPVHAEKLLEAIRLCVEKDLKRLEDNQNKSNLSVLFKRLTAREKEVAQLVSQGLLNKQVADRLGLSERTVQVHRANVFHKLGIRSAAELARFLTSLEK